MMDKLVCEDQILAILKQMTCSGSMKKTYMVVVNLIHTGYPI